mmetsp:Transcript_27071/g.83842  ORF Transcript_27071/g.83842 Transcript_27071/m.83842 type:complete len:238 (+) Transcript_27071:343-1056(+)
MLRRLPIAHPAPAGGEDPQLVHRRVERECWVLRVMQPRDQLVRVLRRDVWQEEHGAVRQVRRRVLDPAVHLDVLRRDAEPGCHVVDEGLVAPTVLDREEDLARDGPRRRPRRLLLVDAAPRRHVGVSSGNVLHGRVRQRRRRGEHRRPRTEREHLLHPRATIVEFELVVRRLGVAVQKRAPELLDADVVRVRVRVVHVHGEPAVLLGMHLQLPAAGVGRHEPRRVERLLLAVVAIDP